MESRSTNILPPCRIPAPSRKRAMEWSLVLISQRIESTIHYDKDQNKWELLVPSPLAEASFRAIRLYKVENRDWRPWRRESWEGFQLEFPWVALVWSLVLVLVFAFSERFEPLKNAGIQDSVLTGEGQWWRLVTAITLHADLDHLISNLVSGMFIFSLCWSRYGSGIGIAGAILSGIGGNLLTFALTSHPYRGLGASGMVMGGLGMLAVNTLAHWRKHPLPMRTVLGGFIAGCLLFVWFGTHPGSDVTAHLGGFLTGCGIGTLCGFLRIDFHRHVEYQLLAFALGCLSLTLCWILALKSLTP